MTTATTATFGRPVDLFSRVSTLRMPEIIVDQIKELIRTGTLSAGDRLPNERKMCASFGVSRVTMREALRVLTSTGLVTSRVGAHGGTFISEPSVESMGASLADLLTLSPVTPDEVAEARGAIESAAAALIAQRATEDDITELERFVVAESAAIERGIQCSALTTAFHRHLALCAHNPVLTLFICGLEDQGPDSLRAMAPDETRERLENRSDLVAAIRERDVAAIVQVMQRESRSASS